jgi:Concanavalin A-like lectin/glucanases superfamily
VETLSPWIMAQPPAQRNALAAQEVQLSTDIDYFSLSVDFESRFAGFAPAPQRPPRPARQMVIPGTLAYWRFDGHTEGGVAGPAPDFSGRGNDLAQVQTVPGTAANALTYTADHHPNQPGHGSLRFTGGRKPAVHGTFLRTAPTAPLNAETFTHGYTFEAFFKIPADFDSDANSWQGMVSRGGTAADAGKTSDYPQEPLVTLSLSGDRELQWNVYPLNQNGPSTNWGHELPLDHWWHVAVVNDGRHSVLYVDGCPLVRNPSTPAIGLTTLGRPWLFGGHENAGQVDQVFNGWLGDVRIVNRPLRADEFMIA